ncbi:hypothetical protein DFH27DRAFT_525599 [Peziza echinospora]|nr:hypothetical protein DFH27DRAFT_525599 [Peziza echinospora]
MTTFAAGNGPHHDEDVGSFDFGGPDWGNMTMRYDDDSTMNVPLGGSGAIYNNKSASRQHLSADSPQGYDPSSGVSSPGLSDHNLDTLSSTSLEDRNDFDNLINYDGDTNNEGEFLSTSILDSHSHSHSTFASHQSAHARFPATVPVKPDINLLQVKPQLDEYESMTIFGNMDWASPNVEDTQVYTGFADQADHMWGGTPASDSILSEMTPESALSSMSPNHSNPDTRPMSAASMTPHMDRHSASPEAVLFHAGLYGGYLTPASIDQKLSAAAMEMEDVKVDGLGQDLDADDESSSRGVRSGGKGKRKSSTQDWDNGLSHEQLAQKRLQAASLENQYQIPQTIPLDTPGSRKKTLNLGKHLSDQPLIVLPLPFSENGPRYMDSTARKQASARLLFINCEFPIKSRVETQTTLRIIIADLPEGVKKLHMPRHTISRPKQMLKDPHVPSPDTLEMDCYVVCETAWRKCPERLVRDAFNKACKEPEQPNPHIKLRRYEDEDDEKPNTRERGPSIVEMSLSDPKNPLNGGEVWVCAGCMDREGKRSTRKKVKRPKEEQPWWDLESRRIVLMNTMEIRDWGLLPKDQYVPLGGMETPGGPQYHVDSPVRIACYCRHQHEKVGYRIIYTIKNYKGEFVAQGVTAILTVTDDHKAEREKAKLEAAAAASVTKTALKPQPTTPQPEVKRRKRVGEPPTTPDQLPYPTSSNSMSASQGSPYPLQNQMNQLNFSHGYPVLSQVNHLMQNSHTPLATNRMANVSQPPITPLTAFTPQPVISQPPSHSNTFIPQSFQFNPTMFGNNMRITPDIHQFSGGVMPEHNNPGQLPHISPAAHQAQLHQQPPSYTSPNPPPNMPTHPSYHRTPQPAPSHVHNVIPSEGPVTGGVPVCVLGINFTPETEVFFGTVLAPMQKFMSDTCLVVTLPANKPGSVPVYTTMSNNPAIETKIFRYIDHNEKMLMELALNVLGSKVAGGKFSASDLARMIIGNNIELRPSNSLGESTNRQQLEHNLLRVLDLIDQDDSPFPVRLDLPDKQTGQKMLHIAAAMGLQMFVAALLARGVDPNCRDRNGNTALHFASLFNHPDVVKKLLIAHVEPSLNNRSGLTALNLASSEAVKMEFRRHTLESRSRHHSRSNSGSSVRYSIGSRQSSMDLPSDYGLEVLDSPLHEGPDPFYATARSSRRSSTVNLPEDMGPPHPTVTRQPTFFEQLPQPNWQMFSNGFQNMRNIRGNLPTFTPVTPTYQQLVESFNRNVVENMPIAPALPNYHGLWQRLNGNQAAGAGGGQTAQEAPRGGASGAGAGGAGDELPPPSYDEVVNPGETLSSDTKTALDMMSMSMIDGVPVAVIPPPSRVGSMGEVGQSSASAAAVEVVLSEESTDELVLRRGDRQVIVVGKPKKMDQMRRRMMVEDGAVDGGAVGGSGTDKMLYIFWIPVLVCVLTAMMWNFSQTRQEEIRYVGGLVRDGVVKVADFVRERVREERNGGMPMLERGRVGVFV